MSDEDFRLITDARGRALEDLAGDMKPLRVDFTSAELNYRRKSASTTGKEGLVRATGARPGLRIMDCTAGLGRDAFILAWYGCRVTLVERSAELASLLEDGLARAADTDVSEITNRMTLVRGDAIELLQDLDEVPDVIYLDPMFPPRRKSALVKGDMQILQRLLGPDPDVDVLIHRALATSARRVVLKRPAHSAFTTGFEPDYTIKGRTSRFEVFVSGRDAI